MNRADTHLALNAPPGAKLQRLAVAIGILAALASIPALAQQNVDTVVTHGKILTVDADFRVVEALAITTAASSRAARARRSRATRAPNTKVIDVAGATVIPGLIDNHFHFTRARRHLAPAGPLRRRRLAPRSARDSRRQGGEPAARRVDHGAGRLDAAAVRRRAGRLHARGARRRGAEESAVRAGGLQRRLREQPGAQSGRAEPGRRRAPQRRGARVVPAAVWRCTTRCRRPRPRSSSRTSRTSCSELNATGLTGVYSLGQSDFLAARAAKGPLPVRLWETLPFNATDPASAAKAAALIERSRPNQFDGQFGIFGLGEVLYGPFFDLAPRKDPWPAEIMNEYGKLATAAARAGWHVHQHVINNIAVTDLLDTLEQVNKTQRIDRLRWTLGPRLRHLARQHRARESARHDARRARRRDAGRRAHAAAKDRRQRHRVRPRHGRDDRLALQPVRDARLGGQRSRRRRQPRARRDADARGGADRAHALERVSVLSGEERSARSRSASRPTSSCSTATT